MTFAFPLGKVSKTSQCEVETDEVISLFVVCLIHRKRSPFPEGKAKTNQNLKIVKHHDAEVVV